MLNEELNCQTPDFYHDAFMLRAEAWPVGKSRERASVSAGGISSSVIGHCVIEYKGKTFLIVCHVKIS